ncbi:YaaA family protein [Auritidibacter ignavus]|uniref:YaaA family protein n=1 Tax=Auritidibacter ignavus TaxID=678932 RepID=UPI00109C44F5|nr:peroxide stress protein YaaA [Auritidibacter ignavus]
MLVLLPPSEGKNYPEKGRPISWDSLVFPQLNGERHTMMGNLATASSLPTVYDELGVSRKLSNEVAANQHLNIAPAAPAHQIYTGVLYEAFDYASLTPAAKRRARQKVLVFSGLFGVTGIADRIPAYRMSVSAKLHTVGTTAKWWRPKMAPWLDQRATHDGPIVDCRSGGYQKMWEAPHPITLTVNVFQMRGGTPKTVSHAAKYTRGRIARALVEADARSTRSLDRVLDVVKEAGRSGGEDRWDVEMVRPQASRGGSLQVILPED